MWRIFLFHSNCHHLPGWSKDQLLFVLPGKTMFIICKLCVGVGSFTCPYNGVKLLSVKDLSLCLFHVLISCVYKLYSFIKCGISLLNTSNISSSFDSFLEPDLPLYLARCSQPVLVPMPVPVIALTHQNWKSYRGWSSACEIYNKYIHIYLFSICEGKPG